MAWIEMHQSLLTHRKTRKAARLLGIPCVNMCGHLYAFWSWALDNAPDGRVEPDDVPEAAQYPGDAAGFLAALIDAGFLERRRNGACVLHDWQQYGGKLCEHRKKNAEKKRRYRAARSSAGPPEILSADLDLSPESGGDVPGDVPMDVPGTSPDREEKTTPEKSRQQQTISPPCPPGGGMGGRQASRRQLSQSEQEGYAALFDAYPRHEKRVEGATLYARYTAGEKVAMMAAARNYAAYVRYFEKEQDRIMLITTFLRWDRRPWLDWTRAENAKWAAMPPAARRSEERDPAPTPGVKGGKYAGIVYE